MPIMFENEDQMKDLLIRWLRDSGFIARRGVYVKSFEIDVAALASARITRDGIRRARDRYLYAFETKIATTYKLTKEVVEQAIVRLLAVDYVYIVVPKIAEIWKDGTNKTIIRPPLLAKKIASGTYSKNLGIIAIDPDGSIQIARIAQRSGLVIRELRNIVVRKLIDEENVRPLY